MGKNRFEIWIILLFSKSLWNRAFYSFHFAVVILSFHSFHCHLLSLIYHPLVQSGTEHCSFLRSSPALLFCGTTSRHPPSSCMSAPNKSAVVRLRFSCTQWKRNSTIFFANLRATKLYEAVGEVSDFTEIVQDNHPFFILIFTIYTSMCTM